MKIARGAVVAVVVTSVAVLVPVSSAGATRRKPTVEFRAVLARLAPEAATTTTAPADLAVARATVASCDLVAVGQLSVIPTTKPVAAEPTDCVVFPDRPGGRNSPRYYLGPAGDLPVADTAPEFVPQQGWTVKIEFTKAGAKAWDRLAKQQFHQQIAITYEGVVVSAPTIQPNDEKFTSFDGVAVVSGSFKQKEAQALALAARYADGR